MLTVFVRAGRRGNKRRSDASLFACAFHSRTQRVVVILMMSFVCSYRNKIGAELHI